MHSKPSRPLHRHLSAMPSRLRSRSRAQVALLSALPRHPTPSELPALALDEFAHQQALRVFKSLSGEFAVDTAIAAAGRQ